jgi:hypothetical protein
MQEGNFGTGIAGFTVFFLFSDKGSHRKVMVIISVGSSQKGINTIRQNDQL